MGTWRHREHAPFQADSSQGPVSAQLLPGHPPGASNPHPQQPFLTDPTSSCPAPPPLLSQQFPSVPIVQIFPVTHWNCPRQVPELPVDLGHVFNHMDSENYGILPTCLFSLLSRAQLVLCKALGCQWFKISFSASFSPGADLPVLFQAATAPLNA